jgi:hypothetical protein
MVVTHNCKTSDQYSITYYFSSYLPCYLVGSPVPADVFQRMEITGDSRNCLSKSEGKGITGRRGAELTVATIDVSRNMRKPPIAHAPITMMSLYPVTYSSSSSAGVLAESSREVSLPWSWYSAAAPGFWEV